MSAWQTRLYDAYVSTGQAASPPTGKGDPYLRRLIRRHVGARRDLAILDLGCGNGRLLHALVQQGYSDVAGVDVSPEQVAAARQAGLTQVRCQDLTSCLGETPAARYDLVFLMDILEHLEASAVFDALDAAHRVLTPGGRVIVHVPNGAGLFGMRVRYGDFSHRQAFTAQSMQQVLAACGFDDVACFEDVPVVHGLVSGARWLIWHTLTAAPRLLLAAETGVLRHILSQNLLVTARRP